MERLRFSSQTMNDLIFWGIHLCVIAIALGIIWIRLDATTRVMTKLVTLQNDELVLVKKQTASAEEQAKSAEQRDTNEANALRGLIISHETSTNELMGKVKEIAGDITSTLDQIKIISKAVVGEAIIHEEDARTNKQAAIQAEGAAISAKTKAAITSGALATKKRQLRNATQVITREKRKNPIQRMFQPVGQ